jgi:hypothetical protein
MQSSLTRKRSRPSAVCREVFVGQPDGLVQPPQQGRLSGHDAVDRGRRKALQEGRIPRHSRGRARGRRHGQGRDRGRRRCGSPRRNEPGGDRAQQSGDLHAAILSGPGQLDESAAGGRYPSLRERRTVARPGRSRAETAAGGCAPLGHRPYTGAVRCGACGPFRTCAWLPVHRARTASRLCRGPCAARSPVALGRPVRRGPCGTGQSVAGVPGGPATRSALGSRSPGRRPRRLLPGRSPPGIGLAPAPPAPAAGSRADGGAVRVCPAGAARENRGI